MRRAVDADPGARRMLEAYCQAWNRDLDALFELFDEAAVYYGSHRVLRGREAIRQMYEASRAKGQAVGLAARVVPLLTGRWAVGPYRPAGPGESGGPGGPGAPSGSGRLVALNHVEVRAGRILAHDLVQGEAAAEEVATVP